MRQGAAQTRSGAAAPLPPACLDVVTRIDECYSAFSLKYFAPDLTVSLLSCHGLHCIRLDLLATGCSPVDACRVSCIREVVLLLIPSSSDGS